MNGETVPGYYVTQSNEEKNVYLMDDGYFYLNVDYSPFPLQRCIMSIYTNNNDHKNRPFSYNNKTYEYSFRIWNIGDGSSVRGSGKKVINKKTKKKTEVKKTPTKKPEKKTEVKKTTTTKPVKKPIKKPTTKPVVKKPVKKPTTKPVKKPVKKPTTKKPVKKTTKKPKKTKSLTNQFMNLFK